MSLFQVSVLKKYLSAQGENQVQSAYNKFTQYFLSPIIQENIKNSKEEEYQGIFLTELFVKILGYTLKPNANFNLVAEYKNQTNARKADGAILNNETALGVIELKGTKTKDLEGIRQQAFDYKANQKNCVYVITSNYEKLRFYINDATEFLEFDLFKLTEDQFALLYFCLQKDNILNNLPLKIKEASISEEEAITKNFYADYSNFKRDLFKNLIKNNLDPLTAKADSEQEPEELAKAVKRRLFKKSQKLIDRFLFIFFAEDRGLLPPNSIHKIIADWNKLKELDVEKPIYERFKLYFGFLDTGRKGTAKKAEIFAYNGGLFRSDDLLDSLIIDDALLENYTRKLSTYDFESQVGVNILGHIFENSLNEIESITAGIEGEGFDKQKSKRKKDGVFYTPKYITQYIVENTVGKLCKEEKDRLGFCEEDYFEVKKGTRKETKKKLLKTLDAYRDWLLKLTICDPACGSGAFLNQTLNFLIEEHQYLDELKAKVLGGAIVFSAIENTILENNIYGVDINEESVEIAKLSLWLRTAQPRRKLNDLSRNIKCGNALIDDKDVAGDKAFSWGRAFPQVFKPKHKKAYHITTAVHDSRTSARMEKYEVRKRRDFGTNPYPNIVYFTPEDDFVITKTLKEIVEQDGLHVLAYNICGDHIHLLLVCELENIPRIMQKIKAVTSKNTRQHAALRHSAHDTREHAPLQHGARNTREHAPLQDSARNTREHAPLYKKGKKKKNKPLWQQKYSAPKEVTSTQQLTNTLNYIQGNRRKHGLEPHPKKTQDLIDALTCTFDQAFAPEFKGGFDVVIGNPPYLRKQGLVEHYPKMVEYYEQNFTSATANYDIYALFMERSYGLINQSGRASFILPHKFLIADFGVGIRKFFKKKTAVNTLVHFGSEIVFAEAATYTCIIDLTKTRKEKLRFKKLNPDQLFEPFNWESVKYDQLTTKNWDLQSEEVLAIIEKLERQPQTVNSVFDKIFQGLATSLDAVYVFEGKDKGDFIEGYNRKYDYHFEIEKEMVKPIFGGRDIFKYDIPEVSNYVIFPYLLSNDDSTPMEEDYIKEELPKAYDYLKHFEKEIRGRERGRMDIEEDWFLYIYPKNLPYFQNPKIMTREISLGCNMTYDGKGEFYHNTKVYSFIKRKKFEIDEKYYLGIMNSKIMWFFLKNTGSEYRGGYYVFKTNYLKPFPLPEISSNAQEIIDLVNSALSLNKEFSHKTAKFQNYLLSQYPVKRLSKKLQTWQERDFGTFIKELNKAINKENRARRKNEKNELPKLTKKDAFEWMELFEENKKKAVKLQNQLKQTETEIDQMVYELYGLSKEEIKIVEES